jgi:predicted permease
LSAVRREAFAINSRLIFMLNDLRLSIRRLIRDRGFATVAVLTLALGIGATTATFSIVNRVVLQPLPYPNADRLVQIFEDYKGDGTGQNSVSGGVAHAWQEQSAALEGMATTNRISANLTGEAKPERLDGLQVSSNYLHVLGLAPSRGRDFLADEGNAGQSASAILTYSMWQHYFGGRTDLVGQTIRLSNKPTTVVGILSPDARLSEDVDFLTPFAYGRNGWSTAFAGHYLSVIGRLKPSATVAALRSEMAVITSRIRSNFPDFKRNWGVTVVPLHEQITGDIRPQLILLFGATACVLLIACSNVAGLLLARTIRRQREMALRLAIGASRLSITRQVLIENVVLSLTGGAIGLMAAVWCIDVFRQWRPPDFAPGVPVYVDWMALAFVLSVSIISGLISGFVPAWRLARSGFENLKSGGRASTEGAHSGARGALIVGQIALSLILLVGAGLLLRSLLRLQAVPVGFEPRGVLAADLTLDSDSFRDPAKRLSYLEQIVKSVKSVPGVESAGLSTYLPVQNWYTEYASADGSAAPPIIASVNFILDGYLSTMRIPIIKGRPLGPIDNRPNATPAMLVDETLVSQLFPGLDPIGQRVAFFGRSYEVVGVTGNVRVRGAENDARPELYLPESSAVSFDRSLVVRTTLPPLSLSKAVQAAILGVAPDQPVSNIRTYEHIMVQQAFTRRLMLDMVGFFGLAAVALAAIGLYGVMAFSVNSRVRELGIRNALGASRPKIFMLVFSGGLRLTAAGVLLGLIGSYFLNQLMLHLLFGATATDPYTLGYVTLLLLGVSLVACFFPAHRATKVDPMVALRAE